MFWKELSLSICKNSYFIDVLHYIERNYNFNPLQSSTFSWFFRRLSQTSPKIFPLFFEPVSNRLPVYGQHQFAVIGRILFHFEYIVLDVKLPPVFFGINPAIASDSLFLCQIISLVKPMAAHSFSILSISLSMGNHLWAFSSKVFSRDISLSLASSS